MACEICDHEEDETEAKEAEEAETVYFRDHGHFSIIWKVGEASSDDPSSDML